MLRKARMSLQLNKREIKTRGPPDPAAGDYRVQTGSSSAWTHGQQPNPAGCRGWEGKITHLRGRAGVEGVLRRAQGRSFSLESAAAVLGLAQLPAKHNRGLLTARAKGTAGTAHPELFLGSKLILKVPQRSSSRLWSL